MISTITAVRAVGTYQDVAAEYYDRTRHPTCAGLRMLSGRYIAARLCRTASAPRRIVEMGAGRSIVAELLGSGATDQLVLVDNSEGMLRHSAGLVDPACRLVADAAATGLPTGSVDVLVSSLGDPYNSVRFWREVARLLRPDGICLFTTPSWAWASAFRSADHQDSAEFVVGDGEVLSLPSVVLSEEDQRAMWQGAGFHVLEVVGASAADLGELAPPKLLRVPDHVPVLTAAMLRR